jgi:hypothetical protein
LGTFRRRGEKSYFLLVSERIKLLSRLETREKKSLVACHSSLVTAKSYFLVLEKKWQHKSRKIIAFKYHNNFFRHITEYMAMSAIPFKFLKGCLA